MLRKAIALALTLTIATPATWAQSQTPKEAIAFAADLAEDRYFIIQREAQLAQYQSQLEKAGDNGRVNTEILVAAIGTVGFTALSFYAGSKFKDPKVTMKGFALIGQLVSGFFALGFGVGTAGFLGYNHYLTGNKKRELNDLISTARQELQLKILESDRTLNRYRAQFPDIDSRLAEAIKSEDWRVKRLVEKNQELGLAQNQVKNEQRDVNWAQYAFAGSVLTVASALRRLAFGKGVSNRYVLAVQAASVVSTSAYLGYQLHQKNQVESSIAVLNQEIPGLEKEYKQALLEHLTSK